MHLHEPIIFINRIELHLNEYKSLTNVVVVVAASLFGNPWK